VDPSTARGRDARGTVEDHERVVRPFDVKERQGAKRPAPPSVVDARPRRLSAAGTVTELNLSQTS
jgi:hypothetical protein